MMDIAGELDGPTEIARRALRDIVAQRLAPTPENYARAYRNAARPGFDTLSAPILSAAAGVPEAVAIIQEIVASVMETTVNLSNGVSTWDKESAHILEGIEGARGKPETPLSLQLILASILSLRRTVDSSHQDLTDTRARVDRLSKDLERFETLASTDSLTGLYNRRAMENAVQHEIARAKRMKCALSFAMLDVDHFKSVNDQRGHRTGDQALVHITTIIKSSIREMDLSGRYGGEEFVIVLPNTGLQGARFVIDRLRVKIENTPLCVENDKITLRVSAGIAELQGDESAEGLLDRADKALYERNNRPTAADRAEETLRAFIVAKCKAVPLKTDKAMVRNARV